MKREIRKYGNRKLYNPGAAAYISMIELSDIVAAGDQVTVVCDLTGSDITLETLCRALYERSKVCDRSEAPALSGKVAQIISRMTVKEDSPR